jgi:hypothetical protein
MERSLYLVAVLLLNSVHTHESIRYCFSELLYLSFLLEANMSYQGRSVPFNPTAPHRAASSQSRAAKNDTATIVDPQSSGRTYFERMPKSRQDNILKVLGNTFHGKRGTDGNILAYQAIGSISEKLLQIQRRGDVSLQAGKTLDVMIEGLSGETTTSDVADIFHGIDPSIDKDELVRNTRVLKPLISADGTSIVSGKIKQLHITAAMADFFAGAKRSNLTRLIPNELYVRDDSTITHAVQITFTDELRGFVKFLEALGCWKWQIEGLMQHLVQSSVPQRVQITSLRIQTIKTGNAMTGPRRVPCSKGLRIIATVGDGATVATLQSTDIIMKLMPFPRIPFRCSSWENVQDYAQNTALTLQKEMEARRAASQCTPPRNVISRIELNFKVEAAQGIRSQQMMLTEMEELYQEALGGVYMGISALQLFPDARGQVRLNGPGIIWVSDLDPDDRKVAKSLLKRLKKCEAACNPQSLIRVGCRGTPVLIECGKEQNSVMTVPQAAEVITRHMTSNLDTVLAVAKPQGLELPWVKRAGDSEVPLDALGPLLTRAAASDGPPMHDIRSLFPNPGPEVTVNMLCEALTYLVQTGNVSMYEVDDDSEQTMYLVCLSTCDAWAMPPPDGAAADGSTVGAEAGGAAEQDSMRD